MDLSRALLDKGRNFLYIQSKPALETAINLVVQEKEFD